MRWRSDSLNANLCQAQQRDLKTIAPLSHRPIVLTDSIGLSDYRFLHYRPNPSINRRVTCSRVLYLAQYFAWIDCNLATLGRKMFAAKSRRQSLKVVASVSKSSHIWLPIEYRYLYVGIVYVAVFNLYLQWYGICCCYSILRLVYKTIFQSTTSIL